MDYLNIKVSCDENDYESDVSVGMKGSVVSISAMFGAAAYNIALRLSEEMKCPVELMLGALKTSLNPKYFREGENTEECERANAEVTDEEEVHND